MPGEIIVLVTSPRTESEKLAKLLVEERLAACVNIMPSVRSIYLWDGNLCDENEDLLIIKSTSSVWEELSTRIGELHSYDVPEIIAIPIQLGAPSYLNWLNDSVKPAGVSEKG